MTVMIVIGIKVDIWMCLIAGWEMLLIVAKLTLITILTLYKKTNPNPSKTITITLQKPQQLNNSLLQITKIAKR